MTTIKVTGFTLQGASIILELFSGSAGVTAACKRRGWHSCVAVDRIVLKRTLAHVIQLDLTNPSHQSLVHSWMRKPEVVGVFMAPPCGTASLDKYLFWVKILQPDPCCSLTGLATLHPWKSLALVKPTCCISLWQTQPVCVLT